VNEGADARPANTKRWRRLQLAVGLALTLVSLVFLVRYAVEHHAEISLARFGPLWAAASIAIYAAALAATAAGWVFAVRAFGNGLPWRTLAAASLISQIGKYAPGNIAQHVGRIALAQSQGLTLAIGAKSTALELPSAVVAGIVLSVLVAFAGPVAVSEVSDRVAQLVPLRPILGLLAAIAVVVASWLLLGRQRKGWPISGRPAFAMFGVHCLSAGLAALSFYAMARAMAGPSIGAVDAVFAFLVAWLAGFVTPGAPAGLGVRETLLVLGLPQLGPAALGIAIGHRVVTAIADVLMALTGIVMLRGVRVSQPPQGGDRDGVMR